MILKRHLLKSAVYISAAAVLAAGLGGGNTVLSSREGDSRMGLTALAASAPVFSAAFSDNAVLQQGRELVISGTAPANSEVTLTLSGGGAQAVAARGRAGAGGEWSLSLPAQEASFSPRKLEVSGAGGATSINNLLFGEVWVCAGQSNMSLTVSESGERDAWAKKERHSAIRFFRQTGDCKPDGEELEPSGSWETAEDWSRILNFSAIGYYYAENLYSQLNTPVGIITAAVGGTSIMTWLSRDICEENPEFLSYAESKGLKWDPEVWATSYAYYNAYVAPFRGYQAAGMLWYQGEADADYPRLLEEGIPLLMSCWSDIFSPGQGQLPLVDIELSPWTESYITANEYIRRGVEAAGKRGKTVSFAIYDLSYEADDPCPIHPRFKQKIGERGAAAAATLVYQLSGEGRGPLPLGAVRTEEGVELTFSGVGDGLCLSSGSKLKGFMVSYREGSFIKVSAQITGDDSVFIPLRDDKAPLEIGYALYTLADDANLVNSSGFVPLSFHIPVTSGQTPSESGAATTEGRVTEASRTGGGAASTGETTRQETQTQPPATGEALSSQTEQAGESQTTFVSRDESLPEHKGGMSALPWIVAGAAAVVAVAAVVVYRRRKAGK